MVKGAFAVIGGLAQAPPAGTRTARRGKLEKRGLRVLAVASGATAAMKLVGLIALQRSASYGLRHAEWSANCTLWGCAR